MRETSQKHFTPKLFSVLVEGYRFANLRADLIAGLTVAVVALPLAMAIGIASGSSPDKGLITAVIAGFLISFFGGSRVQIGGPTGAFVVIVYDVIAQFGYDGLLLATLMAGMMLIIAGYARFGRVLKYIPHPVVTGFTSGIAVIIASTQVKEFFGLRLGATPAGFISQWKAYFDVFDSVNIIALSLGVAALGMIILLRKYVPRWPGYLIVMVIFSLVVMLFDLPVETIGSRFPNIPSGISLPQLPTFTLSRIQQLLPSAFTIAFLAGIEALLSAVVADGMTGFKHRSNQELVAQGLANIGSASFGGLPATGAIARTATNVAAGGRSPLAGIFHAGFVLVFIYFGMDLIKFIPMSILAAILYIVAWGMSDLHNFLRTFRLSSMDRFILLLTFFLTVFVDLTVAIGVGVALASLLFMARMSEVVEVSKAPKEFNKKSEELDQRAKLPPGVEVFWIAGPIFFAMTGELLNILKRVGPLPKVLILRMRLVPYLDVTGAAALADLVKQFNAKKTVVIFSALQEQPFKLWSEYQTEISGTHVEYAQNYEEAISLARRVTEGAYSRF